MDIRSSLDSLKSLLGTNSTEQATTTAAKTPSTASSTSGLGSDSATFSSAGSEISMSMSDSDASVRADKVTSIQAALSSNSYNVSPAAIASKLVDSMLVSGQ